MILVFGSINVDLVTPVPRLPTPGETVLGDDYSLLPGGKGANQALAAARDGARVMLAGAVGRDGFAEVALGLLRAGGVDLSLVEAVDRPTGCASISVAAGSGENLITVASGANLAANADLVPETLLGPATTLLLQMEVPAAENARLIARARRRGARILLNLAPAGALDEAALRALDVLIANEGELGSLGGDAAALARRLAIAVVVTLGARGARAALPDGGALAVPALPVVPVDTTGAGDTFAGILAASLDGGLPIAAGLARASVAAGLACTAKGAQPGMPERSAIDSALKRLSS